MSIRLGGALKELRIHLCQTSKQSAGVREFIQQNYVKIKHDNPGFPILIRECSGIQPRVWARYESSRKLSANKHFFILWRNPAVEVALNKQEAEDNVKKLVPEKGREEMITLCDFTCDQVMCAIRQLAK